MSVTLTAAGEALIARLQAEGTPLVIDRFVFADVPGQDHTQPANPAQGVPTDHVVHEFPIPQEYRAFVAPNQVVYSALLGSDVGPFSFNWQGLYCTEHATLVAVATFPRLEKRRYDPATNTQGNNLTRNFLLEFSGARELTQITVEAAVWQLDFTVRLKGIDERERLSNRDIYGRAAFLDDGWLLTHTGGAYRFEAGRGYVEGIRAALPDPTPVVPADIPCEVWLDVSMQGQGSDVVTVVTPLCLVPGAECPDYVAAAPHNTPHYCEKVARIEADGSVTDLRPRRIGLAPEQLGAVTVEEMEAALASIDMTKAFRDMQAGTARLWPSLTIPVLADGLPLGLPLDGAVVSLATYPRLARMLCPAGDNAWAPAWYRCTAGGTRDVAGGYIKLDDWRGGFPQVIDAGAGRAKSTVLVNTTAGSANATIVNNLSAGGTLITPYTGSDGIYPGLAVSGAGIPAGATVVNVAGTVVTLSAAATVTGASIQATVTGRVLGSWQGDAERRIQGTYRGLYGYNSGPFFDGATQTGTFAGGGFLLYEQPFDTARVGPVAPTSRPAGPVANVIILV
ncbi:MAG TPA: phage tail protein [Nitratidesulfovibrio sp.]|nr:phage tail protein [Nitratidesulfovibrio sp.]